MRRTSLKTLAFGISLIGLATVSNAQWVAFNDHAHGGGTSAFATTNNIRLQQSGPLKNILNGTNLPVVLSITNNGGSGITFALNGVNPAVGTPAYNTFRNPSVVEFGATPDNIVQITNSTVTYTFSNLNPNKRYHFLGTVIRGGSTAFSNRWTKVQLVGATASANAHTANVITSTQAPADLQADEAAFNSGINNTGTTGDMVGWDLINPGSDGVIQIVSSQYRGFVPNGGSATSVSNNPSLFAFAINGIRLEELPSGPPAITTPPASQTVEVGSTATFTVVASGAPPLTYRWYKNNVLINGASAASYTTPPTILTDNGSAFKVSVSNATAVVTSTPNAILTVTSAPPSIVTQPQDQTSAPGSTATFSVTAAGSPTLRYQWFKNGSMIAAATNNSYTTPTLSFADNDSTFSVAVMNNFGPTTNSRNARLLVSVPPRYYIPRTNSWKYNMNGQDLGSTWHDTGYNDSAWSSGRGGLGVETDTAISQLFNTTLNLMGTTTSNIWTFYFRTHFTVTADPYSFTMIMSNMIDDAAVYYLNGQEIPGTRYNLPAPPAPIVYNTPANGAATEGIWVTNVIPPSMIVQGDNVLAVEVHQVNLGSSDIVFIDSLTGITPPPSPLSITTNPPDRTVTESASTTFSVGFNGTLPSFQWYRWVNDVPVPIGGATRQDYTITNVALGDAGYYFVVITNPLGSAVSSSALLTVGADLAGPTLVAADGSLTTTNVTVSFSEFVSEATATNIANYKLTNVTSGGTLAISRAVLDKGTNVILTTAARVANANYLIVVNNVQDISPRNNAIVPNSSIPVSSLLTLIGLTQGGWDYYDPVLGPPDQPYYPGAGWNQLDFNFGPPASDQWGHGAAGLFVYDLSGEDLPATRNTVLSQGCTTKYFRNSFSFNPSPVGAALRFRHVVDDGIIVYLNGVEVYRFNMPNANVTELTPASTTVGIAVSSDYIELPPRLVRSGTNVFAVELHGLSPTDLDWVFGAELQATIGSFATGAVVITSGPSDLTVQESQSATFSFNGVGASTFQWRTNGTAVPGATNAFFTISSVPLNWNGKLISVAASNSTSFAISTNARLTVIADSIAPAVVSAAFVTNTSILVTFSEAVTPATANAIANYRLTNSAGPNPTVQSAVLSNGTNVTLGITAATPGTYRLVVNGIRDASSSANLIVSNSTVTLGFNVFLSITNNWRYNQTGENLGTAWKAPGFNDNGAGWAGGLALLYNEGAALPEPKNTPLSLTGTTTAAYNYTFYFRQHFNSLTASTNATITLRHIIDDSAVMYLNGVEFYRFNIADPIDYQTQGAPTVGDASYSGVLTATVTNVVAGDNVIAVEVHQSGTNSSDIVFGSEYTIVGNSFSSAPVVAPPLQISKQGTNVVVNWSGTGYTLERKAVLSPSTFWAPVTNQAPLTVSPRTSPNPASFYRLRK